MQVGNSKVKKILVGDKVIYRDSDGWIPVKLGDEVEGMVFFKDNGNGICQLVGAISGDLSRKASTPTLGIYAPSGYAFTQVDWNNSSKTTSILAAFGFGKGSSGVNGPVFVEVINGNLYFYNPNTSTDIITIRFTQSASDMNSASAAPAIIKAEQV